MMVKEALKAFITDSDSSFWVHSRFITDKRMFSVSHLRDGSIKLKPAPWFSKTTHKYKKNDFESLFKQCMAYISSMYQIALKHEHVIPKKCPVYIRFFDGEEKRNNRDERKRQLEEKREEERIRTRMMLEQLAEAMGKKSHVFEEALEEVD